MQKLNEHKRHDSQALSHTIGVIIFACSLISLSLGVAGIVENKTPLAMANLGTLTTGFVAFFEYHILIISGALGLTLSVWLVEHR